MIQTASPDTHLENAATLAASRFAASERELHSTTAGQVDAILDSEGRIYLLRAAQEHLRNSERILHSVVESIADIVVVLDRGGTIFSVNRAVRKILGYEPGDLVGASIFSLVNDEDLLRLHSAFFNVAEGIQIDVVVGFRQRTHDGEDRVIEATISKFRDQSDASVVMVCRDMSLRRPVQEEADRREATLLEASRAKDHFLAILSHELRKQMAPVLLGVDELLEDKRDPWGRPVLEMIRRNICLQARLLEDLFAFVQLGVHKIRVQLETIDAHQVTRFILEVCKPGIIAAKIDIKLALRATKSTVLADPVRLQQVIGNLIENAIKFSRRGGSIRISSLNDASLRGFALEIADDGIGIEPEFLPRIFEPYQRGHLAKNKAPDGLGLGLPIAKGLAEAQRGTLTAESEGHGKGSTFRLELTLAPESPAWSQPTVQT
jgi:two-component system CheB/CheR fusion protein